MRNLVFTDVDEKAESIEVPRKKVTVGNMLRLPIMAKLDLTYGENDPSVVVVLQGYLLAKSDWVELARATFIPKDDSPVYLYAKSMPRCMKYKLVIETITDVKVDYAWIGAGRVPD